ncbi:hypothetical protein [Actinomadura rayongensis]|uniref:Uncharacterized protein n=1 Tax=Actinomadura rayongensis TaxID=1429076 RepID=A0A6I4W9M2_9ACTN|nr:hypothetical protein [Actinomadura rayongensis]MXQ66261.1 hypothetical protein [Actinomadura rayongensis]
MIETFDDIRRRTAATTQTAARIMVTVQALLQDVDGAIDAGQWEVAGHAGRAVVLECCALRGTGRGGEPSWPVGGVAFDPFARLDPAERAEAADLLDRAGRLGDAAGAAAWRDRLAALVDGVTAGNGIAGDLPELRSPAGMFAALRLARDGFDVVAAMHLAPVFPESWTTAVPPAS